MTDPVNYFEIGTPDPTATRAFFGDVFGWTFGPSELGGYGMVNSDSGEFTGGLWDTTALGSPSWAIFYVEVADIQAKLDAAAAHGAQIVLPLVDNGTIQFAHLIEPSGNRFGVWQRNTA
mgnify:CR=1 FL=1